MSLVLGAAPSEARRPAYMPQLDGLRAISFLAVAAGHWFPIFDQLALPAAWLGVIAFFGISGFLITGILLRHRERPRKQVLKAFFARRFLRIFPVYYAVIFAGLLISAPRFVDNAPWLLTYTFNMWEYSLQHWQGSVSHLWSLSVEEQFYLLWPWLILLTPARRTASVLTGLILTAPLFRAGMYVLWPESGMVGVLMPSCLDSLGIGALMAVLWHTDDPRTEQFGRFCLWGGLTVLIGFTVLESWGAPKAIGRQAVSGAAMLAGWLVLRSANGFSGPIGSLLQSPSLRYLGKISYGLYIFHNLAPLVTLELVGEHAPLWQAVPLHTAITLGLAVTSWHFFEAPINALKSHFPYRT